MIKVEELRIGNLIKWTLLNGKKSNANEVELICKDGINIKGVSFDFKEIEPIPLTEEWLLKFDLRIKDRSIYCKETSYYESELIVDIKEGNVFDDMNALCNKINLSPIKYVHQLQNLIYALTGKELTIKN